MEKRSKRMILLISLAKREEETKARTFQQVEKLLNEQKSRLIELEEYYKTYKNDCGVVKSTLRVQELMTSRGLLHRLAEAKSQQASYIEEIKNRRDQARQDWHEAHLKVQSFEELKLRSEIQEVSIEEKAEQKKADEWAAIAFFHRENE